MVLSTAVRQFATVWLGIVLVLVVVLVLDVRPFADQPSSQGFGLASEDRFAEDEDEDEYDLSVRVFSTDGH